MADNSYRHGTGITGAELEKLEDFDVGRIDEKWPVDEFGSKVGHGNSICHTLEELEPGYFTTKRGLNDPPEDPARSRRQYRMMQAAAHGHAKNIHISPSKAKEFVSGVDYSSLPEKKK